jgi:hypothetical protein
MIGRSTYNPTRTRRLTTYVEYLAVPGARRTSIRSVLALALVVLRQLDSHFSRHIRYCTSGLSHWLTWQAEHPSKGLTSYEIYTKDISGFGRAPNCLLVCARLRDSADRA